MTPKDFYTKIRDIYRAFANLPELDCDEKSCMDFDGKFTEAYWQLEDLLYDAKSEEWSK